MLNYCLWTVKYTHTHTAVLRMLYYAAGNKDQIIRSRVKRLHELQVCMTKGSSDSLGVDLFPLFLQCLQHFASIQDQTSLFVFLVQFHQHVLHLRGKNKKQNSNCERATLNFPKKSTVDYWSDLVKPSQTLHKHNRSKPHVLYSNMYNDKRV